MELNLMIDLHLCLVSAVKIKEKHGYTLLTLQVRKGMVSLCMNVYQILVLIL